MGVTLKPSSGWRWEREGAAAGRHSQSFSARLAQLHTVEQEFSSKNFLDLLFQDPFLQQKLEVNDRAELVSLALEKNPEVFFSALLHFGQRLQDRGRSELAAELYSKLIVAVEGKPLADQAQKKLDALVGRGSAGLRAEILFRNFAEAATDYRMIVPMVAGTAAFQAVKFASLFRQAGPFAASGIGFAAEVSTFTLLGRGLMQFSGESVTWGGGSVGRDIARNGFTLGVLKLFGLAARQGKFFGPRSSAAHFELPMQWGGLVAAHRLEESLGLRHKLDDATTLIDALADTISLGVGGALGRKVVAGRGYLELQNQIKRGEDSTKSVGLEPVFSEAALAGRNDPAAPAVGQVAQLSTGGNDPPQKFHIPAELINILRKARRVTVLAGAGLSAESGIPTFREGAAALWSQVSMEEVATPEAFAKDPAKVWRWHQEQVQSYLHAAPNRGHFALAMLERRIPEFTLITQNIDGLHQRAGSKNVLELHGNILQARCALENRVVEKWEKSNQIPPPCPHCGQALRPNVVWFGEQLSQDILNKAVHAAHHSEVFLSIGTSSLINPAAALALRAVRSGQSIVEINLGDTPLTRSAGFSLRGPAGKVLPALVEAIWPLNPPSMPRPARRVRTQAEELADRYRPQFGLIYGEKLIQKALTTQPERPNFGERLLEAYAQEPDRGTLSQLYRALAIHDLFYANATASSLSSFDATLLQTAMQRTAADPDSMRRNQAFQEIFRAMEAGLDRRKLTTLLQRFGYADGLRVSQLPLYPPEFAQLHQGTARLLEGYRDSDRVALLNLVHEMAPTDAQKARRLIRWLAQVRRFQLYPSRQIDLVLDYANTHPLGKLIQRRMLQVLVANDLPAKLQELIDEAPKHDTLPFISRQRSMGASPEDIARKINGTHHTAYLKDIRLARKVVSVMSDIPAYLNIANPHRMKNFTNLKLQFHSYMDKKIQLGPGQFLEMLEANRPGQDPLVEQMRSMLADGTLEILVPSDQEFFAITRQSEHLEGCDLLFFLQSRHPGEPHRIVVRALPSFDPESLTDRDSAFHETMRRVKVLAHEGTHLLQAIGKEESMSRDGPAFDFGEGMERSDRLSSEIMAFLEETRWDAKNMGIEFWIRSRLLGLNLPLYFLHINDQNYFAKENTARIGKMVE